MSNFWINKEGQNTLKGSHTNPSNPPALPDYLIAEFLFKHPNSREDFHNLFRSMPPEEQFRLQEIIAQYPSLFADRDYDQDSEDSFQSHINKTRVNNISPLPPVTNSVKKKLRVNW